MSIVAERDTQGLAQKITALPDPCVACNEYPNPPWNTTVYEWNGVYPERSPEWFAQTTAKIALTIGLRYTTNVDQYGRPVKPGQALALATPEQGIEQAPIACNTGVVDDTYVYYLQTGTLQRERLPEIKHVGDLLQCCFERGLEALWVLTETQLSERATPDFMECGDEWHIQNIQYPKGPALWDDDKKRATFLRAWKKPEYRAQGQAGKEQGRNLYIGYAEHEVSYKFDTLKNPVALLAAISYLEDAIAAPLRFAAHSTGKYTIRKATQAHKAWIAPVASLPEQARGAANDCIWRRDLLPEEIAQGGYVLTGDKNSQYMAGCTSVALGEGEPEYLSGLEINALAKLPTGRYHIRLSGSSPFDGEMLPHPTDGLLESWQYTYTVMLARELGYHVEIIEGYIWRRSHVVLRPWAEDLWAARASLKTNVQRYSHNEARQAAYSAVNTVIRGGMGMLDHAPEYNTAISQTWYRPDWYALIIDIAKYKMFAVMRKYLALGKRLIAVYTDCLYYIGETDNHEIELPGMYERATKLGGFKRKYARAISIAQVAPMFTNKKMDIQAINLQLLAYDRGEIDL